MFRIAEQHPSPLRLALLDVDGTVIDSRAAILAAYRVAFTAVGVPFAEDAPGVARLLAQRVGEAGAELAGDRAAACEQAYRDAYPVVSTSLVTALDGARELLDGLAARGIPIGFVTNKGRDRLGPDLALAGFGDLSLAVVVTAEDSAERKPHPRPIQIALERTGCPPAEALYLGDGPHDVRSARVAGVAAVGAAYGYYERAVLEAEDPDLVVDRPDELLGHIDAACVVVR